jgi:hypothetical protein
MLTSTFTEFAATSATETLPAALSPSPPDNPATGPGEAVRVQRRPSAPSRLRAVIARTDFYWAQYRTIGEADGALKYKNPSAARDQLERDRKLRNAGYEIVHFGWRGIVYEADEVVAEFTQAFARGASRIRLSNEGGCPRRAGD